MHIIGGAESSFPFINLHSMGIAKIPYLVDFHGQLIQIRCVLVLQTQAKRFDCQGIFLGCRLLQRYLVKIIFGEHFINVHTTVYQAMWILTSSIYLDDVLDYSKFRLYHRLERRCFTLEWINPATTRHSHVQDPQKCISQEQCREDVFWMNIRRSIQPFV